ncbi:MAG: hypothetical protein ROZ37_02430 [Aromatoleum sp.]|jgi:molybdopterin-containing oxidoreductase family iron-sulfur binding subunit|uniref:hypothetical protein n=1 Tax=Aromatoleum sp. TaxID=2307007 RepID=UPI0028953A3D|nr:hypothetical protein [Aromatoleum sp.]MDT3669171.1 hypothetical protein [Aromatoleum sp.]
MMRGKRPFIPIRSAPRLYFATPADPDRRRFLHLMGASLALAGSGCSGPPAESILPYVAMPEHVLPGQPSFYATTLVRRGYGYGVLVESNMGRPTKVEGNPGHPASRGATDVFAQASVLQFWDPDRSQAPWCGDEVVSWRDVEAFLLDSASAASADGGERLRVLTGTTTSVTWMAEWQRIAQRYPGARWHRHDPLHDDGAFDAAHLAFGRPVEALLHLDRARVVVSFAADVLGDGPAAVAYAGDFAAARRDPTRRARLYVVETLLSLTGANADERLALSPARLERLVWRLAARLGLGEGADIAPDAGTSGWEAALAQALVAHRGESLLVTGPSLSAETRALVHALNELLGNAGRTVEYIAPVEFEPGRHADSLAELCDDMHAGRVDALLILGTNPVYDAPADLDFGAALSKVPRAIHAGLYRDETARRCGWHLPLAHEFEHWGDARAFDGTASVIQPVIRPLYGARSAREILAMLGACNPRDARRARTDVGLRRGAQRARRCRNCARAGSGRVATVAAGGTARRLGGAGAATPGTVAAEAARSGRRA